MFQRGCKCCHPPCRVSRWLCTPSRLQNRHACACSSAFTTACVGFLEVMEQGSKFCLACIVSHSTAGKLTTNIMVGPPSFWHLPIVLLALQRGGGRPLNLFGGLVTSWAGATTNSSDNTTKRSDCRLSRTLCVGQPVAILRHNGQPCLSTRSFIILFRHHGRPNLPQFKAASSRLLAACLRGHHGTTLQLSASPRKTFLRRTCAGVGFGEKCKPLGPQHVDIEHDANVHSSSF